MHNIRPELAEHAVPIDEVRTYEGNPNQGDVAEHADSLTINGQYRCILRRAETGEALIGNTTLLAARELGWTHVAVRDWSCDDEEARRIVAVDNESANRGRIDDELLAAQLRRIRDAGDTLGSGYTDSDIDAVLERIGAFDNDTPDGQMGDDGALREVSLVYADDDFRSEFMAHVTRLGEAWEVAPHAAAIVLRALELATVK